MTSHCQFPTKTTDLIRTYNIIPHKRVDEMLDWFHSVDHIDGSVGKSNDDQFVDYGAKIAKEVTPTPKDPIFQWISEITHDTYSQYINDCPGPVDDLVFHDYSVRVYPQNEGRFGIHFDQYAGGCVTRLFAVIMYLNTVDEGGETEIGIVTSGGYSPTLNKPISMGRVQSEYLEDLEKVYVKVRNKILPAIITKLPFIKTKYKI